MSQGFSPDCHFDEAVSGEGTYASFLISHQGNVGYISHIALSEQETR
jgi:hypothetical protein